MNSGDNARAKAKAALKRSFPGTTDNKGYFDAAQSNSEAAHILAGRLRNDHA